MPRSPPLVRSSAAPRYLPGDLRPAFTPPVALDSSLSSSHQPATYCHCMAGGRCARGGWRWQCACRRRRGAHAGAGALPAHAAAAAAPARAQRIWWAECCVAPRARAAARRGAAMRVPVNGGWRTAHLRHLLGGPRRSEHRAHSRRIEARALPRASCLLRSARRPSSILQHCLIPASWPVCLRAASRVKWPQKRPPRGAKLRARLPRSTRTPQRRSCTRGAASSVHSRLGCQPARRALQAASSVEGLGSARASCSFTLSQS